MHLTELILSLFPRDIPVVGVAREDQYLFYGGGVLWSDLLPGVSESVAH